ncbi:GDSL-type esterase/lipase family protein [Paenibacillus chondroitinus]|uniref:GDSL-type esterase/lipase family protein n=1 Tax=Paenibacillus chondroitinus TaxID=59842 RepID=A0ABU6DKF9_9BACL|nr:MULTISPECIES: GDSL-type esterase/lipase family protein [Paenibacillus]MCY9662034.1 GDSL-type esterase/lipase family protein [Paenibacillus anseongense]MEB4798250.1 GDSL-type esterase/lipase family protein [Paenibacillus chondroitinus]
MDKTINYLAFGDSLTVGFGAPDGRGFVYSFKQKVEQWLNVPVRLIQAGTNGATTSELLQTLQSDPQIQKDIQTADIITITAGGNDLIQGAIPFFYQNDPAFLKTALQTYESNYKEIMVQIETLRQGIDTPYLIALIGLYNPLPQVPESAYWVQRFNIFLRKLEQPHIHIVQVYDAFVGQDTRYLSDDAIHPNEEGYDELARQVESVVSLQQLQRLIP